MHHALDRVDLGAPCETRLGHRPGHVDREDHVDAFRHGLDRRANDLRTRQRDDEHDERGTAKRDEHPAEADPPTGPRRRQEAERGEQQATGGPPPTDHAERKAGQDDREEDQQPRVLEAERGQPQIGHEASPWRMSSYCSATAARRIASSAERSA